jgi:integrase
MGVISLQKRVYLHFKSASKEIGAPNARVHDLRRTYAVLSLQNGDDVKTVQENLGHASAAFTLDVYGHVSDKMKQDSAARMAEYIRRLNASGT